MSLGLWGAGGAEDVSGFLSLLSDPRPAHPEPKMQKFSFTIELLF